MRGWLVGDWREGGTARVSLAWRATEKSSSPLGPTHPSHQPHPEPGPTSPQTTIMERKLTTSHVVADSHTDPLSAPHSSSLAHPARSELTNVGRSSPRLPTAAEAADARPPTRLFPRPSLALSGPLWLVHPRVMR